jgi:hypothetical protein
VLALVISFLNLFSVFLFSGEKLSHQWYKSMRTQYTRAKKRRRGKSGNAPTELTERETWILGKMTFLEKFITKARGTKTSSVSICN